MTNSVLLLVLNGYLSILSFCALVIFSRYLYKNRSVGYQQLRPAIALCTLLLGELILRVPMFYIRTSSEIQGAQLPAPSTALLFGGIVTVIALLCVIRVFSPTGWGNRSWLAAFTLASIIVGITYELVHT
jgi:hypothetical protein